MERVFLKMELFSMIKEASGRTVADKMEVMEKKLAEVTSCQTDGDKIVLKRLLHNFELQFKQKWCASERKESRFLKSNEEWLEGTITLPIYRSNSSGRPPKEFSDASQRSKKRKTEEIREQFTMDELTFAASMSQRAAGNNDVAKLITIVMNSPRKARICMKSLSISEETPPKRHSAEEALGIFVNADLTKHQYELIRNANQNLYPCYSLLQKAKKICYPSEEATIITETLAEVKLQAILDVTTARLCKYLQDVLQRISPQERQSLELISKWGCDGFHQSPYKQRFSEIGEDDHIFQSSFVPIKLISTVNGRTTTVWQNPTPSSTRFCRPIRIRFAQETTDVTIDETGYIINQIQLLRKTQVPINGGIAKIKHTMVMTMVDGKVCNAVTGTKSTMKCYICGQTSKDFNALRNDRPEITHTLQFGLSTLHARIRFFESILHLSYKLTIQKWQARTEADKKIVQDRKIAIQKRFKDEMGLLVDIPKPGFGNTNDGNTSRRFFSHPEKASEITGINVELIKRLNTILETITSGHKIDFMKFEQFSGETARLYVDLYRWHPMSPTMHKILIHGASAIKHAILPIGQLSEEAAEARNKHYRQYRENFARKSSRIECNRDVLNRLLLTSDPLISSLNRRSRKNRKAFGAETLQLLLPADETYDNEENDSSSENESDEFENN